MKKIKIILISLILIIFGILIVDKASDFISASVVKLYPEKESERITQISITPKVKEGGVLYIKVIPGSGGSSRSITFYKVKPGPDIKAAKSYRFCKFVGTKCKCEDPRCQRYGGYEFMYRLPVTDKFGPGNYYARVYDWDKKVYIIAPFIVIKNPDYHSN